MILVIAFYIYKYEDKNIIINTNKLCKIVAKYSFDNYFKIKNIR